MVFMGHIPFERRQAFSHFAWERLLSLSLVGALIPGVVFAGLVLSGGEGLYSSRFLLLLNSWELVPIIGFGLLGLGSAIADWMFHRTGDTGVICKKERDVEKAALWLGGVPIFFVTLHATFFGLPPWKTCLLVLLLVLTSLFVCYDQFIFHRKRCNALENRFHLGITLGNIFAWLFWLECCLKHGGNA